MPSLRRFRFQPLAGTRVSVEALVRLRFFAPRALEWVSQPRVAGSSGPRMARSRGRGLEFMEVRAYQPGDDVRTIDWRVTARRGRPHTKVYREERERPGLVVLDQSPSMYFGSRVRLKSVAAVETATLLAWALLAAGDRVGGIVVAGDTHFAMRPRRTQRAVVHLLDAFARFNQALVPGPAQPDALQLLRPLRRIARPGTRLFIVSDFARFDAAAADELQRLARHCEVSLIAISDTLERELPTAGLYSVSDGERRVRIDTAPAELRERYAAAFHGARQVLAERARRVGAALLELDGRESLFDALATARLLPRGAAR